MCFGDSITRSTCSCCSLKEHGTLATNSTKISTPAGAKPRFGLSVLGNPMVNLLIVFVVQTFVYHPHKSPHSPPFDSQSGPQVSFCHMRHRTKAFAEDGGSLDRLSGPIKDQTLQGHGP